MAKFFVDAFADMFDVGLKNNNLELAPSKIKYGKKIIDFTGWERLPNEKIINDIKNGKYSIVHITQQEWINFFTPFLEQGEDIAFFTISLKLFSDGGCDLQSAFTQLSEDFPERKVCLIDTKTVSRGTSNIAILSSALFKKEQDFDKAIKFATDLAGQFVSAFVVDDVNFLSTNPILKQTGMELTGGMLNVKPIISINKEGTFALLDKARGFKTAVNKLLAIAKTNGENIADYPFSIVFSNAELEALNLKNQFSEYFENNEVTIIPSSLNNRCIVGPRFVGITFHGKQELKN